MGSQLSSQVPGAISPGPVHGERSCAAPAITLQLIPMPASTRLTDWVRLILANAESTSNVMRAARYGIRAVPDPRRPQSFLA